MNVYMTKVLVVKRREIIFGETIDSWNHNIYLSFKFEFYKLNLNIGQIVPSPVGWTPRATLRVQKSQFSIVSDVTFLKPIQPLGEPDETVLEGWTGH